MNITLINNLYHPHALGGGGASVRLLAEALADEGHSIAVITLHPGDHLEQDRHRGVDIYRLPLENLYWPFSGEGHRRFLRPVFNWFDRTNRAMARNVETLLDNIQPDLVHTNNLYGFSTQCWRPIDQHSIPLVHTLRDYYLTCLHAKMLKKGEVCESACWDCRLWTGPQHHRSKRVDGVVGVSEFILEKHIDFGLFESVEKQTVIYNPLPSDSGSASEASSRDSLALGFLGRLASAKGVEWMLEQLTSRKGAEYRLFLAGEGVNRYENELKQRYSSEMIRFLGHVKPAELFLKIDLLIVPSLWPDPLPRVIYEAYEFGIPVLVSNRGGSPEIVNEGETGWVYDPSDPESFWDILDTIRVNPRLLNQTKEKTRKKAEDFQAKSIARSYLDFYQDVIQQTS